MKADTVIALLSLAAGVAAAYWTYRTMRGGAAAQPASLYHAKNNPNGFVWLPSIGGYARTLPNGATEYLA